MNNENDEKPNPRKDPFNSEFENARRKEQIYKDTIHWFETDEKAKAWLNQFRPDSLRSALDSYAYRKAGWIINKERNAWYREHEALKYKNEAEKCLGNIQQKKLFDKQCLWRAEQFKHPAIETTQDFFYWECNVLNCPFLDPVTQEDVDLYISFLETYFGENLSFLGSWQDYDSYNSDRPTIIKMMNKPVEENDAEEEDAEEEDTADELMPPWYQFYDTHRGGGSLLLLPDVRKPKELAYANAAIIEEQKEYEKKPAAPVDPRPSLNLHEDGMLLDFIEEYEKDSKEVLDAYHINEDPDQDDEGLEEALEDAWFKLSDCKEPFPIARGITDWREALIMTAEQWEHKSIIKLLPIVYDEYIFRRQCGIEHPYDKQQAQTYREMADNYKARILRGRQLKGEPMDFNF